MTRDTTEIAREIAYELRGDQLPWSNRGTAIMDRALLADRIEAAIDKERAEIARLTACLKGANAQAEHFERYWYLRGDEIERLRAETIERCAKIAELPPITDTILCGDTCDYIARTLRAEIAETPS